ncbi:hypothetical protein BB558_003974 [Smittium angustum]|uniref:EXS domain-containing protein n=1 Tax=Smittium angustum TaxID=133377 RepID=A0A2U1J4I5_SMIAN|nr:hypothetical protein BB558_003974 [Smittium angustum]
MSFSLAYQSLVLLVLCALGWGIDLWVFNKAHVPAPTILKLSNRSKNRTGSHHGSVLKLSLLFLFAVLLLCYIDSFVQNLNSKNYFQTFSFVLIFVLILFPFSKLFGGLRLSLLRTVFRVLNFFSTDQTELSDIVFTDVLTSCSKTFADISVVFCSLSSVITTTSKRDLHFDDVLGLTSPDSNVFDIGVCNSPLFNPLITSIPYSLRLYQCIRDYYQSDPDSLARKRHIANAVKYLSSFPVIFLSAFQKKYMSYRSKDIGTQFDEVWFLRLLFFLWFLSAFFSSLYSFYWDIAFDWDLGNFRTWNLTDIVYAILTPDFEYQDLETGSSLFSTNKSSSVSILDVPHPSSLYTGPPLLRSTLVYKKPIYYYLAMCLDLLLRATWTIKLSSHIEIDSIPYSGFILNLLEIIRRSVWILFRVEKEHAQNLSQQ